MFPIALADVTFIAKELTTGVVSAPAVTPTVPPVPVRFKVVRAAESTVEFPKFVNDTVLIVFATVVDAALLSAIVTASSYDTDNTTGYNSSTRLLRLQLRPGTFTVVVDAPPVTPTAPCVTVKLFQPKFAPAPIQLSHQL